MLLRLPQGLPVLVALAAAAAAAAEPSVLLPAEETVAQRSQEDWSRAWWQWAGSFAFAESPVADRTGERCAARQAGDVWFLAGTYGTHRTVRTCKVPRGKHLFFPLINYVVMPPADRSASCEDTMGRAARLTDGASHLVLEIDDRRYGGDLMSHRLATRQCFDMGARAQPRVRVYPSAANGYYVMLRPLPPGTHVLNFGGVLPHMQQAVTYTLIVE